MKDTLNMPGRQCLWDTKRNNVVLKFELYSYINKTWCIIVLFRDHPLESNNLTHCKVVRFSVTQLFPTFAIFIGEYLDHSARTFCLTYFTLTTSYFASPEIPAQTTHPNTYCPFHKTFSTPNHHPEMTAYSPSAYPLAKLFQRSIWSLIIYC